MMSFDLQSPEMRKRLEVREKPYYARVTASIHLGYRKGKSIARWVVRRRTQSGYRTSVLNSAVPDDRVPANGSSVLSYQQAIIRAMNMATKGEVLIDTHLSHCSFCGKPQTEVKVLIAGPNVFVCDQCVGLCNGIIAEHDQRASKRERDT